MSAILDSARTDASMRVVVLRGGGGTFCSGADLVEDRSSNPLTRIESITRAIEDLYAFPCPVIAQVTGTAAGAGFSLAMCCDFVFASDDARFIQVFIHRGLSIDTGSSWLLPRLIGVQQAKRLALLGQSLSAQEAERLGLVLHCEPAAALGERVRMMARELAAMPPVALAQDKALINESLTCTFADALQHEARAQAVNFATADAEEGRRAFLEKRSPVFTGRWLVH